MLLLSALNSLELLPDVLPHSDINFLMLSGRKAKKEASKRTGSSKLPNLKDHEAVQKFFLQEVCG